jgi:hypothetical protein
MLMVFHMLMLKETTTQELPLWIQMPKFGKERKSMMAKFMAKKSICKMQLIYKHMDILKRIELTLDYHILQQLKK